jgi:hypothetical protein
MRRCFIDQVDHEEAVSHLIEYIIISGILILLIIITMPVVSNTLIEKPTDQLTSYAFTDIANGISTRIVDIYAIPYDYSYSNIYSKFDIPDDVAGRGYYVEISPSGDGKSQNVTVSRGGLQSTVTLAGIGATRRAGGNTTGQGINQISYRYP